MLVNEARVRDVVEPAKRHALQEEKPRVLSDAEVAALLGHHEDALPISDYNLSIAREAIETSLRTNFHQLSSIFEHYAAGADGDGSEGGGRAEGGSVAEEEGAGDDAANSATKMSIGEFFVFVRDCRLLSGLPEAGTTRFPLDGVAVPLDREEVDEVFRGSMVAEAAAEAAHAREVAERIARAEAEMAEAHAVAEAAEAEAWRAAEPELADAAAGVQAAVTDADADARGVAEGAGDDAALLADVESAAVEDIVEDEAAAEVAAAEEEEAEEAEEDVVVEQEVKPRAFIEAVVHIALRKILGHVVPITERLDEVINGWITPNALQANLDSFRSEVAIDAVQRTFVEHDANLKAFFKMFCQVQAVVPGLPAEEPSMLRKGWMKALGELKLITRKSDVPNNLPEDVAKSIFASCQMEEENESSTATGGGDEAMIFMECVNGVCVFRVCCLRARRVPVLPALAHRGAPSAPRSLTSASHAPVPLRSHLAQVHGGTRRTRIVQGAEPVRPPPQKAGADPLRDR